MKLTLLCTLTTLGLTFAAAHNLHAADKAQATSLTMASDVWQPFTDEFQKTRFAIDLVHSALGRAGIKPETKILEKWTVPADLKAGKYDGCGAMWYSKEREDFLLFSEPYLENRLILIGQKGSKVDVNSLSELAGKKLILVKGYAYGDILDTANGVLIGYGANDIDNIGAVLKGVADYALVDELLLAHLAKEHKTKAEDKLAVGSKPLSINPLHLAIRKDIPGAQAIITSFNKQIRIMLADGSYNRILRISSIRADVDGDGVTELVLGGEKIGPDASVDAYDYSYTDRTMDKVENRKRYWVNGKLYEDWDNVPEEELEAIQYEYVDPQGMRLFERTF
ncbi:MAG: substrate-binding periplasmic protein [Coraliomargarita sp.]